PGGRPVRPRPAPAPRPPSGFPGCRGPPGRLPTPVFPLTAPATGPRVAAFSRGSVLPPAPSRALAERLSCGNLGPAFRDLSRAAACFGAVIREGDEALLHESPPVLEGWTPAGPRVVTFPVRGPGGSLFPYTGTQAQHSPAWRIFPGR